VPIINLPWAPKFLGPTVFTKPVFPCNIFISVMNKWEYTLADGKLSTLDKQSSTNFLVIEIRL